MRPFKSYSTRGGQEAVLTWAVGCLALCKGEGEGYLSSN